MARTDRNKGPGNFGCVRVQTRAAIFPKLLARQTKQNSGQNNNQLLNPLNLHREASNPRHAPAFTLGGHLSGTAKACT